MHFPQGHNELIQGLVMSECNTRLNFAKGILPTCLQAKLAGCQTTITQRLRVYSCGHADLCVCISTCMHCPTTNTSCQHPILQVSAPPDEHHLPLTFEFPEGCLIGIAKEKLPVIVSFYNTKSISFTANVVFLDEEGKRFSLPITGTTDNSLLTIKPFIEASRRFFLQFLATLPQSHILLSGSVH